MRKFRKSFSVDGAVNVSVEFDDDDIEFMTEEEIIELAHEQLREYAEDEESNYSLVDDMNDFEEIFEQAETPVLFLFFFQRRASHRFAPNFILYHPAKDLSRGF